MIIGRKYWFKKVKSQAIERLSFRGWEEVRTIAVVVLQEDQELSAVLDKVADAWHHDNKQVQVLRVSRMKMTKSKASLREHNTIYWNETNWKGIPNSSEFNEFVNRQYDVVLHLCKQNDGLLEFLPYLFKTGILVGPSNVDMDAFDLQIQLENRTWKEVFQEIENWLKKIKNVA
ncbi:DUF6913 domain-containing protein [Phaeocystidibacter luteus]|uniref:Uncharacterized protein n=1 Tax=Phaeocystidibacter luteus TaxID=911197 RepID=A0A6N6RLN8_9FLAO|nr:hypothetical protein [Phaeocystidibacter luteus]KAB2814480.1 hypothetical protein F8C67_01720 [Phaeocystidibacter luteus]